MNPHDLWQTITMLSTFDKWWYGLLAIFFLGIRYNPANGAGFIVLLFCGLVWKSLS